jgi:photosystem II stability/assembly factor-like uncharacterized protein
MINTRRALLFAAVLTVFTISVHAQTGWAPLKKNTSTDLISVYFLNADRGWIGGDDGYFATTYDGGNNWTGQKLQTTGNINDIYFRNESNGYVLSGDKVFVTQNGGQLWTEANALNRAELRGTEAELYSVRFSDKKRGWIVGSISKGDTIVDSLVLRTADAGMTWTRVRVPATEELFHLDFVNETKGWIVGSHGIILFTEDAGQTWQRQTSGINTDLFYVDFKGSKDGWAVGSSGNILRTDDGGRNWFKVTTPYKTGLLRVAFVNDDQGFIVGKAGLILRTDDKGRSWLKQDSKTTEALYGLFVDKKTAWAVGGKGVTLKYLR